MSLYSLADSQANTPTAVVDDVTLTKGGEPQELTDDQASRLRAAGASLVKKDKEKN